MKTVGEYDSEELKACKKERIGEQADQISNLPDAIIHYIFSFIPTIYVVRTSVLAKRWRYLWTQTPTLEFNDSQFPIVDREDAFIHFVNGVHSLYNAPNIQSYHLFLRQQTNAIFVDTWVPSAVDRNVKELNLDMINSGPFEMPCCGSLIDLTLNLGDGSIMLPTVGCFSSLETLSLSRISFTDDTVLNGIFQRCPRLRSVKLINCFGMNHLNIRCPLLEQLEIGMCIGLSQLDVFAEKLLFLCVHDSLPYGNSLVKIIAPNLETFKWLDYIVGENYIGNFASLKAAQVSLVMDYDPQCKELYIKNARKFLNYLACAESLQVEIPCFWGLSFQKKLLDTLTPAHNLKHLKLLVGFDDFVFREISNLFNICRNLETLQISTIDEETFELLNDRFSDGPHSETSEHFDKSTKLDHLWEVKICGFRGKQYEIEFLEHLLKNAGTLRRMIILFSIEISMDPTTKAQIVQKLTNFERAAPNATIISS